MLREIVGIARAHEVDAVLVAGDLYDTAAPSADAQKLVNRTLLGLARDGVEVIAIAGNHDHAATIDAYRGFAKAAGITLVGTVRTADERRPRRAHRPVDGGARHPRRAAVPVHRATPCGPPSSCPAHPAEHTSAYDQHLRDILGKLTAGFRDDAVNLVMAHLTVLDGKMGGGERAAQSIFEYAVPAAIFPVEAHYVALGHLHRRQTMAASCPVHYSGAPLAVDFGEQENTPVVCVVEAAPGTPAAVTDVPIQAGRRLRTLRGTVAELSVLAEMVGDDFLRVWVREPARAGLREEVTALLPNALEVRIDPEFAAPVAATRPSHGARAHTGRAVRRIPRHAAGWPIPGSPSCSARCTTRSPADAPRAAGDGRVRVLPRAHHRRLRRRRVLRPGRAHRRGQVHGDRRDDVRPVRLGAALGQRAHGGARAGADRRPRHGAVRVRRRGRAAAPSATSSPASCGAPRAAACRCAPPGWSGCAIPRAPAQPRRRPSRWPTARRRPPRPSRSCSGLPFERLHHLRGAAAGRVRRVPARRAAQAAGDAGAAARARRLRRRSRKEANAEARSQEQRAQVLSEQLAGYADDTAAAEQAAADAGHGARGGAEPGRRRDAGARRRRGRAGRGRGDDRAAVGRAVAARRPRRTGRPRRAGRPPRVDGGGVGGGHRPRSAPPRPPTPPRARPSAPRLPRGPLEQARRHHAERASIAAELPGARDRQAKAAGVRGRPPDRTPPRPGPRSRRRAPRGSRRRPRSPRRATWAAGSRAERDALRAVVAPAGLDALEGRRASAVAARDRAVGALAAAERADVGARSALAAAPDRAPFEQARRDHRALVDAPRRCTARRVTQRRPPPRPSPRRRARARNSTRTSSTPGLGARRACAPTSPPRCGPAWRWGRSAPVCAQPVAVLPAPLPEGDLAAADRALAAADSRLDEARRAEATATAEHARRRARQAAADTVERLTAALTAVVLPADRRPRWADPQTARSRPRRRRAIRARGRRRVPSAEVIEAALAHLDGLAAAARAADEAARRARAERDTAAAEVEAVRAQAASAAAALRTARDPLVGLGAPTVADEEPGRGWSALVEWAAGRPTPGRRRCPPRARATPRRRTPTTRPSRRCASAEEVAEQRRREETAAARAEQEADRARRAARTARIGSSRPRCATPRATTRRPRRWRGSTSWRTPRGPPTPRCGPRGRRCGTPRRAATRRRARGRRRVGGAAGRARPAGRPGRPGARRRPRRGLGGARRLGAGRGRGPCCGDPHAPSRRGRPPRRAAARSPGGCSTTSPRTTSPWTLAERPPPRGAADSGAGPRARGPAGAKGSPSAVASAAPRPSRPRWSGPRGARPDRRAPGRGRAARPPIATRPEEAQQVAKMLGHLLRSDGFPRWLVASALDALVADASVEPRRALGRPVRAHPRERRVPRRRPHRRRRPQAGEDAVRRRDVPGQPGVGAGALRADVRPGRPRRRPPGVDLPGRGVRHPRRGQPGARREHPGDPRRARRPRGRRDHPRARPRRAGAGAVRRPPRPAQLVGRPGGRCR